MNRHRKIMFTVQVLIATFSIPLMLHATVPEAMEINLKDGMWCYLAGKEGKPTFHTYSEKKNAIFFHFLSDGVKWADIWLKKNSIQLPVREKYTISVSFRVPKGSPLNTVSLRMRDSENETFQYPKKVDFFKRRHFQGNLDCNKQGMEKFLGRRQRPYPGSASPFSGIFLFLE